MGDKTKGLYGKFIVQRADGSDQHGGKHHGCEYFVLDLSHDKHAYMALRAYTGSEGSAVFNNEDRRKGRAWPQSIK